MADETENLETLEKVVKLPRFKDKVMYIPAENSTTKVATSYVISSSFKGIVRLSPNNHNTTYEKPTYQLSINDDSGTTYSDAIVFDNDVENAINSEADITKRMIIGSDSDGYTIGFRISKDNFEFDNLGVIGVAEASHLSLISAAQSNLEDVLLLNNHRMPHLANKIQEAANVRTYNKTGEGSLTKYEEVNPFDYHAKDVKITGDGDNSYLLISKVANDGKSYYKFQKTIHLIRDLILEALMDFQTIPTGSIHWFPVTIEQFKTLVEHNGGKPNVSFNNEKKVDPLLRDFLLCDGRRYNNKDFPELAKTLWKEPIRRWRKHEGYNYMSPIWDTECNNYGKKKEKEQKGSSGETLYEYDFTFRVPDLRHQFISSTTIDGTELVAIGKANDGVKNSKNVTGGWCPDKTPHSSVAFRTDRHAHFVAYGSYGKKYHTEIESISSNNILWNSTTISGDIRFNNNYHELHQIISGNNPHVMLLHNHPYSKASSVDGFRGFGWRYNSPTSRIHSGIDSIPATMWLSRPSICNTDLDSAATAFYEWRQDKTVYGMSSPDVTAAVKPSNYSDIDEDFNGNKKWGEEYEVWGNYQDALYGHESTPKYYAMLPFIKI